jgi:hypothetical protein
MHCLPRCGLGHQARHNAARTRRTVANADHRRARYRAARPRRPPHGHGRDPSTRRGPRGAIDEPSAVKGSFWARSLFAGLRQDTEGPRAGRLLVGQHTPVDEIGARGLAAGRRIVLRTTPLVGGVTRFLDQTAARRGCSDWAEVVVDLASDVAHEHADDFLLGTAFFGSALDVEAGAGSELTS